MVIRNLVFFGVFGIAASADAQNAAPFDAAAAFGARPSVSDVSLSPDGQSAAYVSPLAGQGSALFTVKLTKDASPQRAFAVSGNPVRLGGCNWVSNQRLVCSVYSVVNFTAISHLTVTRLVAINADGSNEKLLSSREGIYARGVSIYGGSIIDWQPDQNGAVLMTRSFVPETRLETRLSKTKEGMGVDWVDTNTLADRTVEAPRTDAAEYISDGRGTVRIMGHSNTRAEYHTEIIRYDYRMKDSRDWQKLCDYNFLTHEGFEPLAVDPDLNVVYGLEKKDGRRAVYTMSLDEARHQELVYARPDVDVETLVRLGPQRRVVGVSYVTDHRYIEYTDTTVGVMFRSLLKALPNTALRVADSSADGMTLLIFAVNDSDSGVYYIFDRRSHQLNTFLVQHNQLEGIKLASVKPVSFPAADGTMIPGYLTLPPGVTSAKGLPAIVMPHGGPDHRDEGRFDWFAQFYAARGYAVLQPNFRGSSGYGDQWFQKNGFHSWPIAIADILDAGRWLVKEGIADPNKLGIVGWSYGGYAALQAAVVDPALFKAVIAVAPVTDLAALVEDHRQLSDFAIISEQVGEGATAKEGSPAQHADKIKVPVLLFHGTYDANVSIEQSNRMASKLASAGVKHELVTWDKLDHQLDDSAAREKMLRKSDEWLRQAFGM
jgi:dipeptidyl aminopeptidase/acylaminoacyl peptidase